MDEFLTSVPLHAIAAIIGGHGKHRAPRPRYVQSSFSEHPRGFQIVDKRHREKRPVIIGNLPNEEYRFWRGSPEESLHLTQCRMCRFVAMSASERAAHRAVTHCTTNLVAIYRVAREPRHPTCMVCSRVTHDEKWGVPLCNDEDCISDWKFKCTEHSELVRLRNLARAKGLLVEP